MIHEQFLLPVPVLPVPRSLLPVTCYLLPVPRSLFPVPFPHYDLAKKLPI